MAVLALLLGVVALGRSIQRVLGCHSESPALVWASAIALGFTGTMLINYVVLLVAGRVYFQPAAVVLAGAMAWEVGRALGRRLRVPSFLTGVVVLLGLSLLWIGQLAPFYGYDGKAIFGFKAKVLLHERTLQSPAFQDVDVIHYHPEYPLGVPLLIAMSAWAQEGHPDDPAGTVPATSVREWVARYDAVDAYLPLGVLWMVGVVLLIAHWARTQTRNGLLVSLLVFAALPPMVLLPWLAKSSWSLEGADLGLALCLGTALTVWVERDRGARGGWTLCAAMALGGAFLVKNEALIGLAAFAVAVLCSSGLRSVWKPLVELVAVGAVFASIAQLARSQYPVSPYEEHYLAALFAMDLEALVGRAAMFLPAVRDALDSSEMLAFWAFALMVAVPWALFHPGRERTLGLWVLTYVVMTSAAFAITPDRLDWQIDRALPRIWCHAVVGAGALVILLCAEAWRDLWPFRWPLATESADGDSPPPGA
ncbi:hypothetical protein N9166_01510 [bacterium]|nr:hypothetical protein [bacterium]